MESQGLAQAGAARTYPYTVRTDNAPKVYFSATLGEEPEEVSGRTRSRSTPRRWDASCPSPQALMRKPRMPG